MGQGARKVGIGLMLGLAMVSAATAAAGASEPKRERAPRITHLSGTSANRTTKLTASIDPEGMQSTYELELVYRAPGCCPPNSKECCSGESEVVGSGTLAAASTAREVHASATLRTGTYSLRLRVRATNRVGSSEKSRKIK
jgi:hypothetical protein